MSVNHSVYYTLGFFFWLLGFVFSCPPLPDLPNGIIRVISPVAVRVKCQAGYRYIRGYDSNIIRCRKGAWTDPNPECVERYGYCSALNSAIPHGKVFSGDLSAGTVARYICDDNFELVGNKERLCQEKILEWTGHEPVCVEATSIARLAKKINEEFVDKFSNITKGAGRIIDINVEKEGLDLFLVFDKSNSIHPDDFHYGIKFAQFLVEKFQVANGPKSKIGGTRIAIVTFGDKAKVEIELDNSEISDVKSVTRRLSQIKCDITCDGSTNMAEALQTVFQMVNDKARPQAKKAMFLTSDGVPTGAPPFTYARKLREKDVEIYAIGIGKDINKEILDKIASPTSAAHVFLLNAFKDFNEVMKLVREDIPEVPIAPPTKCGFLSEKGKAALKRSESQIRVGAWPWLAAILYVDSFQMAFHCNGILICKEWILTSAHCLYKDGILLSPENMIVVLGEDDLTSDQETEQNVLVSEIIAHQSFSIDAPKIQYNIGLIKLDYPAELNDNVRTVCLPSVDEIWSRIPDTKGHMIGWLLNNHEITRVPDEPVPIFRPSQAEMSLFGRSHCENYLTGNYSKKDDGLFCAGNEFSVAQPCPTDKGSPFIVEDRQKRKFAIGVVSYSTGCKLNEKGGIFTRTGFEMDWINEVTDFCNDEFL